MHMLAESTCRKWTMGSEKCLERVAGRRRGSANGRFDTCQAARICHLPYGHSKLAKMAQLLTAFGWRYLPSFGWPKSDSAARSGLRTDSTVGVAVSGCGRRFQTADMVRVWLTLTVTSGGYSLAPSESCLATSLANARPQPSHLFASTILLRGTVWSRGLTAGT